MARHRISRRRRSTFVARPPRGTLRLPGDLVRPAFMLTAADLWSWRLVAAYFDRKRSRAAA